MNQLESPPLSPLGLSNTPRRVLLGGLGLLLFALGQFEESVFAFLVYLWQRVLPLTGPVSKGALAPDGLSTHGLPVGITYRLLYCGLSVLVLYVLLRGRHTWWVVGSYGIALTVSMVLLLVGQQAGWALASLQGHQLLDLVCSPLPLLAGYVLRTLPGSLKTT